MITAIRTANGDVFIPVTVIGDGVIGDGYALATEDEKREWAPWTVDESVDTKAEDTAAPIVLDWSLLRTGPEEFTDDYPGLEHDVP